MSDVIDFAKAKAKRESNDSQSDLLPPREYDALMEGVEYVDEQLPPTINVRVQLPEHESVKFPWKSLLCWTALWIGVSWGITTLLLHAIGAS